jgi:hypothetical protein
MQMAERTRIRGRDGQTELRDPSGSNGGSAATDGSARAPTGGDELTFEQAVERYFGEWVLIEMIEQEEGRFPTLGRLVAHDLAYERMWELRESIGPPPPGSKGYFLYQAVPEISDGEGLRRALKEAERIGAVDAWGRW